MAKSSSMRRTASMAMGALFELGEVEELAPPMSLRLQLQHGCAATEPLAGSAQHAASIMGRGFASGREKLVVAREGISLHDPAIGRRDGRADSRHERLRE